MEMEQQLLSMGFPSELAAQAVAATGGKSILTATDWILNRESSSSTGGTFSTAASQNQKPFPFAGRPCQPKLDRFFVLPKSKPCDSPVSTPQPQIDDQVEEEEEGEEEDTKEESTQTPPSKRPKLVIPAQKLPKNAASATKPPLAERMRPRTLNDVVGQEHLLAANCLLRSAIERERLPSLVFWGPPGTGKTSIAKSIINSACRPWSYRFVSLSAVTCGVKDVRDAIDEARKKKKELNGQQTVLFVDEVHRFNKSQQDSFLPVIEDGSIVFMGATTENPSFHLITPLLSRCRILVLQPLRPQDVEVLLKRAADDSVKGLASSVGIPVHVQEEAIHFISANCDGDARVALNALEMSATTAAARGSTSVTTTSSTTSSTSRSNNTSTNNSSVLVASVTLEDAKEALQCKHIASDKAGEEHYNLISALHKSMRGSDADAAIYWLARMLQGGQEPLYIARRLIRFASEDVGLADPLALNQAVACYQACHFLGMPECNVILAQCVAYLALAPKSVAVYRAIEAAQKVIRDSVGQNEGVPLHLRNAPTKLMKDLGYGKGYVYPPDKPSATQRYLPPSLQGYKFLAWPMSNSTDTDG